MKVGRRNKVYGTEITHNVFTHKGSVLIQLLIKENVIFVKLSFLTLLRQVIKSRVL
jgi:hypothetical protein